MPQSNLEISKYRFTLQAQDKITLPAYKGSAFHGGFGHALRNISPTWYRYFYEAGQGNSTDWPKPFVILPPLDEKESYQQGEQFHCELTLFGEATQHYAICQAAIEYLGMQMGLGSGRGKYEVLGIDAALPTQDAFDHPVIKGVDIINARVKTLSAKRISIAFPTRLRLKENNQLSRQAPSFRLFLGRLLGRIKTLERAYCGQQEKQGEFQDLLALSDTISIESSTLFWDDWNRFSGRQKSWMKFGGLVGDISYSGDLIPFLPYLALGEWLHIGGKTSFGLGKYILASKRP